MDTGTKMINYASIAFGGILGASVGWIIYQRTIARARELEIEELEAGNIDAVPTRNGAGYNDIVGDADAAALMNPDDISLWDNEDREASYRDNFADDDELDVFASGDRNTRDLPNGQERG